MGKISCELPDKNPPAEELRDLLTGKKTIAIVGLSDKPERDSNMVAVYLMKHGYKVIPVNPVKEEILGLKSYPDLKSIPEKVDIVDIFRKMDAVPGTVDEALKINPETIWLQLGLAHKVSAEKARAKGINFVQAKCIKVEHDKLFN